MTTTPEQPQPFLVRNRRWVVLVVIVAIVAVAAALAFTWWFFFGTEAPEAPTIDNAVQVLLPSAAPE